MGDLLGSSCWGSGSAPRRGSGRTKNKQPGDDQYEKQNSKFNMHRAFKTNTLLALVPGSNRITRTRLFSVDCGRYRQSGPRPEPRLLRQAALEELMNSARTDSPRRIGRNESRRLEATAAAAQGGGVCERREAAATCV
ncbi:hypothetical protein F511_43882 [Dorcoceras hygrometricum]|uniref:Uncharacterized protein n=1 Tax=Dorcoceras hygrometricum TaxID=472368 RepID=A0A2Z7AG71_9LAMI|nr:hypothetical protein F511_43882 [Dorcoceras hygrometricum]